ncbi:MAG TPA: 5-methyltetrahydropteroyltriglutamate--homocysteine S-methyltransferase [Steroidobacteraceae bacterium]|nr:5-methyltetrahydropteroyltriglutamate--homocysteine S-methyltransferase [Steroidobacteraceae bacterium]
MPLSQPPFRADHVGSLLRPPSLVRARAEHKAGRMNDAALRAAEDEAILGAVRMQEELGLQGITDGEMRRSSWHMDFLYQIGGVRKVQQNITVHFHSDKGDVDFTPSGLRVEGKLALNGCIFGDHFDYLKSIVRNGTPKLTIPSPSMMHYRGGRAAIDESVYPRMEDFWRDLAAVYAREITELGKRGCTYLQLDDTSLAYLNDPKQRDYVSSIGGDPNEQHRVYIRNINAALASKPAGMRVCTHMCRGNFRSAWAAEGGYDHVAEALFNELGVDGFFLEYDDARSGGFEPLRFVPRNKFVVLGLVTTKRGQLESKDELKRRIDEAGRFIPLDQLALSPQCGFSSTIAGNKLTVEEQAAKLRLVVEVAHEVWG